LNPAAWFDRSPEQHPPGDTDVPADISASAAGRRGPDSRIPSSESGFSTLHAAFVWRQIGPAQRCSLRLRGSALLCRAEQQYSTEEGGSVRNRVAALVGAGIVSASFAGQSAAAPTPKLCGTANGAAYSYSAVGGAPLKGSHYSVQAVGVSCPVAGQWVTKLTARTPGASQPDGGNKLTGGPAGFKCEGKSYTYTRHEPPTISGYCWKGSLINPTKLIEWAPARP